MIKKLFTLLVAVWVSCTLSATSVDRQQATQLARDFIAKNFKSSAARRAAQTIPLASVETGQPLVYAFNVEGGGFVVVAGDDCAPAILGYSETSVMTPSDMPDGMKDLFEQYQQEMQYMIANGLRSAAIETLEGKCNPDPYLINDGTSTGMKVTKVERQQTESVYDLQGRRINGKPAKGIYIIGGKKFILR